MMIGFERLIVQLCERNDEGAVQCCLHCSYKVGRLRDGDCLAKLKGVEFEIALAR